MPVTEDLRAIADTAQRELDRLYDFFEHSKLVWYSFQGFVEQGHKIAFQSVATGTAIDQTGLLDLASRYTREYLAAFTFRQFMSVFEVFLFDFLGRLLRHNPWQFARTPLEFETVLEAADRDAIITGVIAKRLNELKYESVREWFEALNRTVRLDGPSEEEMAALAEIKAGGVGTYWIPTGDPGCPHAYPRFRLRTIHGATILAEPIHPSLVRSERFRP